MNLARSAYYKFLHMPAVATQAGIGEYGVGMNEWLPVLEGYITLYTGYLQYLVKVSELVFLLV